MEVSIGSTPFVHGPFLQRLVRYLPPIDYIQLRRTFCAVRKKSGLPSVVSVVREWVDMYLDRYMGEKEAVSFKVFLWKGRFHLSGGFMLAILRGDAINPEQDLDFYTTEVPIEDEQYGLPDLEIVGQLAHDGVIDGRLSHPCPQEYEPLFDIQVFGHTTTESFREVQFISTRNIRETVSRFDFAFCKNIYGHGHVYVDNPDAVSHQKCTAVISDKLHKTYELLDQDTYAEKYMNRIDKYQQRGFQIDLILQDEKIECGWPWKVPESILWEKMWFDVGGTCCIYRSSQEPGPRCGYCRVCKTLAGDVRGYIIQRWNKWWHRHIEETSKSGIYRLYV